MASSFPGGLDNFTNPTATDTLDSATVPHADQHANANDAIEAIESTLGVNPQGSSATVVARLTALDSTVTGKAGLTLANIFTTGAQKIKTGADNLVGLILQRNSATQTANILSVTKSDADGGAELARIRPNGQLSVGLSSSTASTNSLLGLDHSYGGDVRSIAIKQVASQTQDVIQVQPSASTTPIFKVDSAGAVTASNITDSALTVAGIVTNTSAGLLGTVATVPVTSGGTGVTTSTGTGNTVLSASPTLTGVPTTTTAAVDTNTTQIASTAFVLAQAGSATPVVDGTAAVGTSTRFARQDHVHPTDTTRAPLASPALTGTPTTTTAAVDTNTTQIASTAFVLAQAGSATPVVDGTAAVGTSTRFARQDHVHPTDTSRAAVAGQTFTGAIAAPNITDSALTVAGIVTNTSAGLLGTVATVPTTNLPSASTSAAGVVQLTDSTSSTSVTTAATPKNVKTAWDLASNASSAASDALSKANAALPLDGSLSMTGTLDMFGQSIMNVGDTETATVTFNGPTTNAQISNSANSSAVVQFPAASGTLIATSDTATVTNDMLAGSIAANKIIGVPKLGSANAFTVGGHTITNASASIIPLTITGAAGQSVDLFTVNDSTSAPIFSIDSAGRSRSTKRVLISNSGDTSFTGIFTVNDIAGGNTPLILTKGATSQTADQVQIRNNSGTVLGGRNAVAQIYSGSTTPIAGTASTITQTVVTAGTNVVYTTSAAHNYGVGDLVTITGITTAQGLPASSPVVVTAVSSTTFTAAVTTGTSGTYTSLTGSSTIPAQASVTARSAGTVGLIVKGATSQATALLQLQDSGGTTLAQITQAGNVQATNLQTLNSLTSIGEENSGARVRLTSATATPTAFATGGTIYTQGSAFKYLGSSGTGQTILGADGSGALSINTRTADSSAITATTLTNIFATTPALTLEASTSYMFRLVGAVNRGTATASTLSVRLTMSSSPTTFKGSVYTLSPTAASTALHTTNSTTTESQIDVSASGGTATTTLRFFYEGFITTSATGGTLTPQFIQSANASSVIQAGTYIQLIKVASATGAWA
jgi:hypothetical protein